MAHVEGGDWLVGNHPHTPVETIVKRKTNDKFEWPLLPNHGEIAYKNLCEL